MYVLLPGCTRVGLNDVWLPILNGHLNIDQAHHLELLGNGLHPHPDLVLDVLGDGLRNIC